VATTDAHVWGGVMKSRGPYGTVIAPEGRPKIDIVGGISDKRAMSKVLLGVNVEYRLLSTPALV
jgi:hypothetical protein